LSVIDSILLGATGQRIVLIKNFGGQQGDSDLIDRQGPFLARPLREAFTYCVTFWKNSALDAKLAWKTAGYPPGPTLRTVAPGPRSIGKNLALLSARPRR
jgi:hypothetical protein